MSKRIDSGRFVSGVIIASSNRKIHRAAGVASVPTIE